MAQSGNESAGLGGHDDLKLLNFYGVQKRIKIVFIRGKQFGHSRFFSSHGMQKIVDASTANPAFTRADALK
jgi:hypothetical protein